MNKFFSRSGLRSLKRTAKDIIGTSQTSNNILAPLYVPIQEVKKFNESLQQSLPNMTDIASFLHQVSNGYNRYQKLSLAGAGSSRFSYPSFDNSILFSKPLDGSERPGDIKTGTTEQDPTHTTQKPIKTEIGENTNTEAYNNTQGTKQRVLKKRMENVNANAVPASSFARAFQFAGLGLKLASSALGGKIKGTISSNDRAVYDSIVNDKNADLITSTLCRMRGIPLKLGQTLSIQDDNLIPKPFKEALERAQRSADIMPDSQVDQMLKQELGVDWMDKFQEFDRKPIAAASIGQVHKAVTKKGEVVAVKVQYPGVADSIDSDLQNLKRLVTYLNLLPKTMYIDNILNHTRTELKEECDYILEGQKQTRMKELLAKKKGYRVPAVIDELTTKRVLTSEWVDGIGIDECQTVLDQEERDRLGHRIFHLVLTQLFELRYVQTDPNPANFFYNPEADTLSIIDYGAAREYSKEFVSNYLDVIYGAATHNPELVYSASVKMGFLTGEEGKDMKEAHVGAVMIVGEPFAAKGAFDFGSANMTARIYEKIPHMVKNRLRPPPQEVYSLHRILSGAFLACMKLKARVHVGKIFKEVYTNALPNLKS